MTFTHKRRTLGSSSSRSLFARRSLSALACAGMLSAFAAGVSVLAATAQPAMSQSRSFTPDPVSDERAAAAKVAPPQEAAKKLPMETGYYDRFGLPRGKTVRVNGTLVTTAPPAQP